MTEETLTVGAPTIIPSDSPDGQHAAFFEDDGERAYFYALDPSRVRNRILDALHIYNVANVVDQHRPSRVSIAWSEDGLKCALLINGYPHAAFDFSVRRGYCRTNSPNFKDPADGSWTTADHSWSDEAVSWLNRAR